VTAQQVALRFEHYVFATAVLIVVMDQDDLQGERSRGAAIYARCKIPADRPSLTVGVL
jgi:hypothetical protein